MKHWSIKKFRSRGASWVCDVYLDGVKSILVEQRGNGGCAIIHPYNAGGMALIERLEKEARAHILEVCGEKQTEATETWIIWMVDGTRSGKTEKEWYTMSLEDMM